MVEAGAILVAAVVAAYRVMPIAGIVGQVVSFFAG